MKFPTDKLKENEETGGGNEQERDGKQLGGSDDEGARANEMRAAVNMQSFTYLSH